MFDRKDRKDRKLNPKTTEFKPPVFILVTLVERKHRKRSLEFFFCFEMREDISAHVSSCKICDKNKRPNRATKAMMGNMII